MGGLGGDNMTAVLVCFPDQLPSVTKVDQGTRTAQGGILDVFIALPATCKPDDVMIRVCEGSVGLHIGLMDSAEESSTSTVLSLEEHLPVGASLVAPRVCEASSTSSELLVQIPW